MAATDQTYRPQRTLDIVFGASCLLMLVSIVVMFAVDQYRAWKVEQRTFRDVEEAMADRNALQLTADPAAIKQAEDEVHERGKEIDQHKLAEVEARINTWLPRKVETEAKYQAVKADYDSVVSLYNIAVEEEGPGSKRAEALRQRVKDLKAKLDERQLVYEESQTEYNNAAREKETVRKPLTEAVAKLEKMNGDFDRFAKNAVLKRWKTGDWFRTLPGIDAFASPTRIQQFTLEKLPINYNFKYVTRYDRCMTCHQGMDRGTYEKVALHNLQTVPADLSGKLQRAQNMLRERQQALNVAGEKIGYDPDYLRLTTVKLDEARVNAFCAHPRLDLFVDGNSPHPAEAFGCTICHGGQGSATDFNLASHTPDDAPQKGRWEREHNWESNHFWDYPMLPQRFVESSCLKCHYQVTDLSGEANRKDFQTVVRKNKQGKETEERVEVPAPGAKVVRGYNLVRENGCFGCHEIAGVKNNRWVGPDLRLEPNPPLDEMKPDERVKALSDPANPPGTLRKVGPSLRRLAEKTNRQWSWNWINGPRNFRPDTRMPHFYGLSNNSPDVLPDGQTKFPDAEINAITHYLFEESAAAIQASPDKLPPAPPAKDDAKHLQEGRQLFTERGCLACHSHNGTATPEGKPGEANYLPAVQGEAHFGPNLSRLAAKLGIKPGDKESARRWLVQWIQNPRFHSPRTYMPITHLTADEAAAVADWLLSQKPDWQLPEVPAVHVEPLEGIARGWLEKTLTRSEVDRVLKNRGFEAEQIGEMRKQKPEPDETHLPADGKWEDNLKWYVGKKAISQLGCFGCHDIPGFEAAKPIGTPLNDWGLKDPTRLAFEDIVAFVNSQYRTPEGSPNRVERVPDDKTIDGKKANYPEPSREYQTQAKYSEKEHAPYEQIFYEALKHHDREGFLYQKLREPRSYDHNRIRSWDERLRMPQFKFFRGEAEPREDETPDQAQAREEAAAREAVMTFILGLLAEPIPAQYLYEPVPDKMAVVKGRQVLDKFNCAGCHIVKDGTFEVKVTEDLTNTLEGLAAAPNPADHVFPDSNAWTGQPPAPRSGRLAVHGLLAEAPGETWNVRLTRALAFHTQGKELKNVPAGMNIGLEAANLVSAQPHQGGTFSNLMLNYVIERDKLKPEVDRTINGDFGVARASLPPPLLREGEKTQPGWLYQFLRNPTKIRPLTGGLRMPKFSLSEEDARTLVNYFDATDKMENPGLDLNYPYITIPQRDKEYWTKLEDAYRQKKPGAKEDAYATDAYRLIASYDRCLNCHQVGDLIGSSKLQGPPLALAQDRLRPGWTLRWIASPNRILIYPVGNSPMPANFARDQKPWPEFDGDMRQQADASRNVLMDYHEVAGLPENRNYKPKATGGNK